MIMFLADHRLDPRLRKRVRDIITMGFDVRIATASRGGYFSSDELQEESLGNLRLTDLIAAKYIYVSGNKIIITHFLYLFVAKCFRKATLYYEIPDLPIRSNFKFINKLIKVVYNVIIWTLFDAVIITSPAFSRELWGARSIKIIENLNFDCWKLKPTMSKKISKGAVIGFIGVYRYLKQQELLMRFCDEYSVAARYHGGPPEIKQKLQSMSKLNKNLQINGEYTSEDLPEIYSEIEVIFAVYDTKQLNVRLALPNKLYEAIFYQKPIIVAKGTYLADIVNELQIGIAVDAENYEIFKSDMRKLYTTQFVFKSDWLHNTIARNTKSLNDLIK